MKAPTRTALGLGAVGFTTTSLGAVLVLVARDLSVSTDAVSWLAASFGLGLVAAAGVGPWLLGVGAERVLRAGSGVLAVGASVLALSATVPLIAVGALGVGLGGAAVVLTVPVLLGGPGAAARLSTVNAVASGAGVLAPASLGVLDLASGRGRLALLLVVAPLVVAAATPAPPVPAPPVPVTPVPAGHPGRVEPGTVARHWGLIVLAVSIEFCFVVWSVARLIEEGLSAGGAAIVASAFPLGLALARLAGPRLLDRVPVILGGATLTALGTLLVIVGPDAGVLAAGLLLSGLGVGLFYPVTLAGLIALPGLSAPRGAALGALAAGVAILVAPLLLAALAGAVGLAAAFAAVFPLLVWLTWAHRRTARAGSGSGTATG